MSRTLRILRCAALLALAFGCEPSKGVDRTVNPEQSAEAGVRVSREVLEAGALPSSSGSSSVQETSIAVQSPVSDAAASAPSPDGGVERRPLWGLQPGDAPGDAGVLGDAWAGVEVTALGARIMRYVSRDANDDFTPLEALPEMNWVVTLPFETWRAMDDAQFAGWLERVWGHGSAVRYVIFGQHLDVELLALDDDEQKDVVSRLSAALDLGRAHEHRPTEAALGLGLAVMTVLPSALLNRADVLALSYSGVNSEGRVAAPAQAFQELKGRVEGVTDLHRAVILQDLSYPSIHGEQEQLEFFAAVRHWFDQPKLPDVLAVVVSALYSPSTAECETWAADFRIHDAREVRCSVGMRDERGASKPALTEVAQLLARFAQP